MAEASISVDQDQFCCSICLDLLKNPATIPCGHSYCMGCIKGYWDRDDHTGVYSCPQCRQTFTPRPVLGRNTILVEVVEKLKKTGLQAAPPAHCYTGPGDVACDICTGRKYKAIKSCLVCLASYCVTHLQTHYESPALKKHKLVKATGNLQEKICSHHDKLLEIYCRTDQQCICSLCSVDEHRGHDTVSAAAERTDKQKQLVEGQSKFQQRIQEREKELQDLRQAVQSLKRSAQTAVEDSERIFTELIRSIERRCSEVKKQIRDQEKAEVSRAEGFLERLEQEIAELKRRDAELEQLSHTEDHIHFLQSCESVCVPLGPGDLPSITVSPHISFDAVKESVSELKKQLEDICKVELVNISDSVKEVHTVELRTREDFLQCGELDHWGRGMESSDKKQYFIIDDKDHYKSGQICFTENSQYLKNKNDSSDFLEVGVLGCFESSVKINTLKPLTKQEAEFLYALDDKKERLGAFRERGMLELALNLTENSLVTVEVKGKWCQGVVRYIGGIKPKSYPDPITGTFFGIELQGKDSGKGLNEGQYAGKRYFSCSKNCGIFVPFSMVRPRDPPPPGSPKSLQAPGESLDIGDRVIFFTSDDQGRSGMVLALKKEDNRTSVIISPDLNEKKDSAESVMMPLESVIREELFSPRRRPVE